MDDFDTDPEHDSLAAAMAGRVLTHRVTAEDAEAGVVDLFDPDLSALTLAIDPDLDLDEIALPPGAVEGSLVALRAPEGQPTLVVVAEDDLDPTDAHYRAFSSILDEHGPVTHLEEVAFDICEADPTAFTAPTLPLSEIAQAAGLEVEDGLVGVAGTDLQGYRFDLRLKGIATRHQLDDDQAVAVLLNLEILEGLATIMDIVAEVEADHEADGAGDGDDAGITDGVEDEGDDTPDDTPAEPPPMDPDYREAVRDTVSWLADPDVAEAFSTEVLGIGRHRAAALGLFAESYEPIAPRQARAALRWLRARATERLGDALAAERLLDQAESLDPGFVPALLDLARYASDRGDAERGLSLLRRAGMDDDDPLVRLLEEHRTPERADVGRNSPCWCGSGRKYKACHRGKEQLPLTDRADWLYAKAHTFLEDGPWRMLLMDLARARTAGRTDVTVLDALYDPFVIDVALAEGGGFDAFLDERGPLLPEDELLLAGQWEMAERSLYDVEQVRPGQGVTVRDVRTGDRVEVQERLASYQLKPGMLVCSRVLAAGDTWQFWGGLELVGMNQRDEVLAILDADEPDPIGIVEVLSANRGLTQLQNTEGDPLVLCRAVVVPSSMRTLAKKLDAKYDRIQEVPAVWHEPVVTSGLTRVRATIEMDGDSLVIESNSEKRQDRVIGALITLDPRLEVVSDERTPARTIDEARAHAPAGMAGTGGEPSGMLDPSNPQVAQMLAEVTAQYEAAWLDESIPALSGWTPRQAAADPTRRDDVVRLLGTFPETDDPGMMSPARLRRALGLD
jgi:hypothetical protein